MKRKRKSTMKVTVRPDGTRVFTIGAGVVERKHTPAPIEEEATDNVDRNRSTASDPG